MLIGDALFIIVYRVCCIEFCFAAHSLVGVYRALYKLYVAVNEFNGYIHFIDGRSEIGSSGIQFTRYWQADMPYRGVNAALSWPSIRNSVPSCD